MPVQRLRPWGLAAIFALASLLLSFNSAWAGRVRWMQYSDALREARKRDHPVLLYFFSDKCAYCRKMDAQTFRSRRVVEYLRDAFVSVRIRAERSPHLVRKYMVRGYPTSWFLTPAGRAIVYVPGYQSQKEFTKVLRYVAEGHYKSRTLQEYLRGS